MVIPLDGLLNRSNGVGQNLNFLFLAIFLIVPFHLVFVVASEFKLIPDLSFHWVTLNGLMFDMPMYPDHSQNWLDFGDHLLISLILVPFWVSETGQIRNFHAFFLRRNGRIGLKFGMFMYPDHL